MCVCVCVNQKVMSQGLETMRSLKGSMEHLGSGARCFREGREPLVQTCSILEAKLSIYCSMELYLR